MSLLVYVNYYYKHSIILPYTGFPEPVANKLRRAVYYTSLDFNPQKALKYYKQALQVAQECGMDGFSGHVMGIKVEMGRLFEKDGKVGVAVQVLERVRDELVEWMDEWGMGYEEGRKELLVDKDGETTKRWETEAEWRKKRTTLLVMAVRASCHLGNLYTDPRINDGEKAEERLVWGVTALLKERQRREDEGAKEGEEGWFRDDEVGAALEGILPHPQYSLGVNSIANA